MHDRELELVVELLGEVLRVDDRLVGADDRVDVLEEDDPRRDLVRPADLLRLLLVLAEVAGRVEELLRDDRCAKLRLGERDALAASSAPPSSNSSRMDGNVEDDDLLAVDVADPVVVERDELHATASARRRAARRRRIRISPLNGRTTNQ